MEQRLKFAKRNTGMDNGIEDMIVRDNLKLKAVAKYKAL